MIRVKNTFVSIIKDKNFSLQAVSMAAGINDTLLMSGAIDEKSVRESCATALREALSARLPLVVLPIFGVAGGFPAVACAKIMSQEILRVARDADATSPLKEINIYAPSDETFDVFEKQVYGYLKHVVSDLAWGPYVCVDAIIEIGNGVVMIERTNPPFGWALPGGFVDRGESLEAAVVREAKEETGLDLKDLRQFHTYSDPARDPRFHTITTMFTAKGVGTPKAGDDAKGIKVIPFQELGRHNFAFDHNKVMEDYLFFRGR